ncbi:uncharacterized protein CLUP02_03260 [Colletotrichum lupini]|uniref:Uncharacterized protein n=1 Tax=Colletotrichum lupini TaxID=145971 RepID=A0A9Q8SI81_9PEZI|nr:uncharacterized protein CLUP02_03260 [Colletotrichum lupini]UQC77789.1 hypothetical protein CLUP02_03260 [Colletotrichum lupini]
MVVEGYILGAYLFCVLCFLLLTSGATNLGLEAFILVQDQIFHSYQEVDVKGQHYQDDEIKWISWEKSPEPFRGRAAARPEDEQQGLDLRHMNRPGEPSSSAPRLPSLPAPEPGPGNGVGHSAIGPAGPSAHVEAFEKTWLSRGAVQSFRMRYKAEEKGGPKYGSGGIREPDPAPWGSLYFLCRVGGHGGGFWDGSTVGGVEQGQLSPRSFEGVASKGCYAIRHAGEWNGTLFPSDL